MSGRQMGWRKRSGTTHRQARRLRKRFSLFSLSCTNRSKGIGRTVVPGRGWSRSNQQNKQALYPLFLPQLYASSHRCGSASREKPEEARGVECCAVV